MRKYNKLVRDKVPETMESKGVKQITHVADDKEYWQKLKAKLTEETNEFLESEELEEIADILEVIDAICLYKNFDKPELAKIKQDKRDKRGGFEGRLILDEAEEY